MGRRFGKYTSGSDLPDATRNATRNILEGLGMEQQSQNAREALKEKMLGRKAYEKRTGLEERRVKLKEQAVPMPERQMSPDQVEDAMQPVTDAAKQVQRIDEPISSGEMAVMNAKLKNWADANNIMTMPKAMKPFENRVAGLSDQGLRRFDVYKTMIREWDNYKGPILESIGKAIELAEKQGNFKEVIKLGKIHSAFDAGDGKVPDILKNVFSASYRHEQSLLNAPPPGAPKKIEEVVARHLQDKPEEAKALYEKMIEGKGKGKGAGRYPDDLKTMIAVLKILGKGQYSAQDLMMAKLVGVDLTNEEQTEKQKMIYENVLDELVKKIGIKTKKKAGKADPLGIR